MSEPLRRAVQGITIDASSTRDIDDALWISFDDNHWHIYVSIADVADTVRPGTPVDQRAKEMVATKYFATGNSPMLPRRFAEDELSLWPERDRKTLTVDITVRSPEMQVVKTGIYPSWLKSLARVPYEAIPKLLQDPHSGTYDGVTQMAVHDVVSTGCKMALALLDRRRKAGALVLYDLNNGWITTEEGFLRQIEKKEETIGYILIQEMMVLANSLVAEFAVKNDIPVLFRNHTAMSAMPDRKILMSQIQDAITTPLADVDVVRARTHMLLGRANYSDSLLGHYGLNLPAYLHFTSPIRRYADLVTHRQIKAHLAGEPLPYTKKEIEEIALHINDSIERERERASMHFKTKAEAAAHRAIDDRRLDGLDAIQFERVTKVEVRSGGDPSEAFEGAYLRRLKENRLPLICMTLILTEEGYTEGWKEAVQATIDRLAHRPEEAISVITQATQIANWAETKFSVASAGPDHARTFTCEASLVFNSETVRAASGAQTSSKLAKQLSVVALLAKLHGAKLTEKKTAVNASSSGSKAFVAKEGDTVRLAVAMPDKGLVAGTVVSVLHVYPDAYEVEAITTSGRETITLSHDAVVPLAASIEQAAPATAAPTTMSKDPVSALMEFAQKTKVPAPEFQFDKSGPDHVPTITCTCTVRTDRGRVVERATASSKQDAKKQAARLILDALRGQ